MTTLAFAGPVFHFNTPRMSHNHDSYQPYNNAPTIQDQSGQVRSNSASANRQKHRALDFLDLSAASGSAAESGIPQSATSISEQRKPRSDSGSWHGDGDDEVMEDYQDGTRSGPSNLDDQRREGRKMKRFRLTHNQTRFLMSEFARQPHPDAAHRDYLSREIPGLSPRQVQVWFQNRRAKLKRLPSEDREKMLKSRALPEEFNSARSLDSQHQSQPPNNADQSSNQSNSNTVQHNPGQTTRPGPGRHFAPPGISESSYQAAFPGQDSVEERAGEAGQAQEPPPPGMRWETVIILGHTVSVLVQETPETSEDEESDTEEVPPPAP